MAVLGAVAVALFCMQVHAAVPQEINFQGRLTDTGGTPIDGALNATFRLYDAESGGSEVWSESFSVTATNGYVSAILGQTTAITPTILSATDLWLEVNIEGEVLTPRFEVAAAPYAVLADTAEALGSIVESDVTTLQTQVATNTTDIATNVTAITGKADTSHAHSGADIASGTVGETYIDAAIARDAEIMTTVLANDGSGSTLDTDLLDGLNESSFFRLNQSENMTGIPLFMGGSGVVPDFYVTSTVVVPDLNADLLDGQHASAFADTSHNHFSEAWTGSSASYGLSVQNTGTGFGLEGRCASTDGIGVLGYASASSGANAGAYGQSNSTSGYAVYGTAEAISGVNYGVYGNTESPTGFGVYSNGKLGVNDNIECAGGDITTNQQLISTVATGTAPLSVTSTTNVANLNADLLDGQHASAFAGAQHAYSLDADDGNPANAVYVDDTGDVAMVADLDVAGAINTFGSLTASGDLTVGTGIMYGKNSEYLLMGFTDNIMNFVSGGATRLTINSSGNIEVPGSMGFGVIDSNSKIYVYRPGGDYGANKTGIYSCREGSTTDAEGGTSWSYNGVDCAIKGFSYFGNTYAAAIAGYNWLDAVDTAAVVGAEQDGTNRGMLGYRDGSGTYWAGYFVGNVYATGTITDGSSRELKENITDLTSDEAMKTLEALEPIKYNYKADEKKDLCLGFIAEDVPELVSVPDRKGMRSMDIVAVLTKVVQEQQKTIEDLKQRIEDLEK